MIQCVAVGAQEPKKDLDLWNKLQQAQTFKEKGDLAQAERVLHAVLKESPKFARAHYALGLIYLAKKESEKAAEYFVQAIEQDDQLSEAYFSLGYIREQEARYEDAGLLYARARATDKTKNAEIRYNLANVLARLNRIPQAVLMYKEAIVLNPKHIDALVNLSLIYYKYEDFSKAAQLLKMAIKYGYKPDPQYRAALAHLF